MNSTDSTVAQPILKILSAWIAAIGISSWSEAASVVAFIYTVGLLTEWWWKRFWRPMLEDRGILQRKRRRKQDFESLKDGTVNDG